MPRPTHPHIWFPLINAMYTCNERLKAMVDGHGQPVNRHMNHILVAQEMAIENAVEFARQLYEG